MVGKLSSIEQAKLLIYLIVEQGLIPDKDTDLTKRVGLLNAEYKAILEVYYTIQESLQSHSRGKTKLE